MTAAANRPPLSVWIVAVLVAAAMLLVLANLQRTGWLAETYKKGFTLNLQRLQSVPPGALHVVALGSSKTRWAIDFDEALARRMVLPGQRVVFHRITASGATLDDMRPALEAVAQRPPAVLLVETGLLVFDHGKPPLVDAALGRVRQNVTLLRARLAGGRSNPENRGDENWPSEMRCRQRKSQDALRSYAEYATHWRMLTDAERAAFVASLRRMQAAGTRVVLLTLPTMSIAQDAVPAGLRRQEAQLRDALVKNDGFIEWKPAELDGSFYCDLLHVNQRGREVDSAWLARQLTALFGHSGV